jgi:RTX calcium-binding nonapeptide repeat (4 copies)
MAPIGVLGRRPRHGVWRGGGSFLLACASVSLLAQSAFAAPPNDNFADAHELSGLPAEAIGSTVNATREPGEPEHSGQGEGGRSIWFKWTAPADSGVSLYFLGCAPPFQDSPTPSAVVTAYSRTEAFGLVRLPFPFRATTGQVYWIAAESPPGAAPDPDVCVRLLPGPSNDDFARATPLTGFPVLATQPVGGIQSSANEGNATSEPGEPHHGGERSPSLWYSWTAPAGGPVVLRVCGPVGMVAVYTGDRVESLTHVATGRTRTKGCGSESGASAVLNAIEGQAYRIALASNSGPGTVRLVVGNQVAVVTGTGHSFLSYAAFPGDADNVEVRLVGEGRERALLLRARGVSRAAGCQVQGGSGPLRCPVPGSHAPVLDIDLGDGDDTAAIHLLGRVVAPSDDPPRLRVLGGAGKDTLSGSAGSLSWAQGWSGGLHLLGGPGADRLRGGSGFDDLRGGPGADSLAGGRGVDVVDGGPGSDRIRSADGASDGIGCGAGRDRARLDGLDRAGGCERRSLIGPARAAAIRAYVANGTGEAEDHLQVVVACPIDVRGGCRSRVTPSVPGERRFSRRIDLAPGRTGVVRFWRYDEDRLIPRGTRVGVTTGLRGGRTLRFSERLPVVDVRYEGE